MAPSAVPLLLHSETKGPGQPHPAVAADIQPKVSGGFLFLVATRARRKQFCRTSRQASGPRVRTYCKLYLGYVMPILQTSERKITNACWCASTTSLPMRSCPGE